MGASLSSPSALLGQTLQACERPGVKASEDLVCYSRVIVPRPLGKASTDVVLDLSAIVAPMVNQCDSPYLRLCLQRGATLVFTQMWHANDLLHDESLRHRALACVASVRGPVVVQLAGDNPSELVAASRLFESSASAIDLNLGCPQEKARERHFGSYMADRREWPLVERIISAMSESLSIPVTAKIRPDTLDWARLVARAGAKVVTAHGRTRGSAHRRRAGPACLESIRHVVDALAPLSVPVVSNGNVRCHADVHAALAATGAAGVMSGEGVLEDPGIFACDAACASGGECSGSPARASGAGQQPQGAAGSSVPAGVCPRWEKPGADRAVALMLEYLDEVDAVAALDTLAVPPLADIQHHLAYMAGKAGRGTQVRYRHRGPYASHLELKRELFREGHAVESLRAFARSLLSGRSCHHPAGSESVGCVEVASTSACVAISISGHPDLAATTDCSNVYHGTMAICIYGSTLIYNSNATTVLVQTSLRLKRCKADNGGWSLGGPA